MAWRNKLARYGALVTWLFVCGFATLARATPIINGGFELPPDMAFAAGPSPDQSQPIPGWLATGHADGSSSANANTISNGMPSEGLKYMNLHVHATAPGGGDSQFFFDSAPFTAAANSVLSFDYQSNTNVLRQPALAAASVTIFNANHTAVIASTGLANSGAWRTLNFLLPAPDATGGFMLEFFVHTDASLANPNDPLSAGASDVNLNIDNVRVPEPATAILLSFGAVAGLACEWRRRWPASR
jgi:hypothetical protein